MIAALDIRTLLPHAGRMVLIDRVLRHDERETICGIDGPGHELFRDHDGSVPSWVGLEYMAQCIAVRACLLGRMQEGAPQVGLLVSARGLRFHCDRFRDHQGLEVAVQPALAEPGRMSSFECSLREAGTGVILAEGRVNCIVSPMAALEGA